MRKTAQMEKGATPCERCGRTSVAIVNGVPVCDSCLPGAMLPDHPGDDPGSIPVLIEEESVKIANLGGEA